MAHSHDKTSRPKYRHSDFASQIKAQQIRNRHKYFCKRDLLSNIFFLQKPFQFSRAYNQTVFIEYFMLYLTQ